MFTSERPRFSDGYFLSNFLSNGAPLARVSHARRASPIIASLRNRKAEEEDGKTIVCDKRDRAIICMFCRGLH